MAVNPATFFVFSQPAPGTPGGDTACHALATCRGFWIVFGVLAAVTVAAGVFAAVAAWRARRP